MSSPVVLPDLPHWYPDLSGESHAVQMAHRLSYSLTQQHEQALTQLNSKIAALQAQVNKGGT